MREGFTTGACAAAATQAAARRALGLEPMAVESIVFPDGSRDHLSVLWTCPIAEGAEAAVCKDAGDDPDITNGSEIRVRLRWREDDRITFKAGDGVGTVTLPGLQIPAGQPAINPGPRHMMEVALRSLSQRGAELEVSIPGGVELAARTFNPRLGVRGGLSVLGSTGRVRPFSHAAIKATIKLALEVAWAAGYRKVALVPGHIGEKAARAHFELGPEQVVEVSNDWGFALETARDIGFEDFLLVGHPGKLAKLWMGHWDTHSSRSPSPVPPVLEMAQHLTRRSLADIPTVEGIFQAMDPGERTLLARILESRIQEAVEPLVGHPAIVALCTMDGRLWGAA
ncbi:MAG: cobalamin biosynthesis protein CbiD [Holophagaceae bacterium]|nr:cobalamin biosynthesis protein CbiD [Holophagaceae bacterium]